MSALPTDERLIQLPLFRNRGLRLASGMPDVHAISVPARAFTGDFYFVHPAAGRLWFALGDVAGKGLNAAVIMAMIQEELERTTCDDPAANMERLHAFLKPVIPQNKFATAVVGYIRPDGVVRLANAGHCPPMILRTRGETEQIGSTGPVLGVLSSSRWRTFETTLERGDALVLYSDGVVEAHGPDGEEFGSHRLAAMLSAGTSREIAERVHHSVTRYSTGVREDDLTILVIQR